MEDLRKLGVRIRQLREAANLSGREVAARADISATHLSNIETMKRASRPSAEHVVNIAAALGVDAGELLTLAGHEPELAKRYRVSANNSLGNRSPDELVHSIEKGVKRIYKLTPFLHEIAQRELEDFASRMNLLANGTFRCSELEEPKYSLLAAERCRDHMHAVSYQDLDWWEERGNEYLAIHQALANHKVEMTRIFIVPRRMWRLLTKTFTAHASIGIHTFVVDEDLLTNVPPRDFVIYDGSLVRVAALALEGDKIVGKSAEFTEQEARLEEARNDFDRLLSQATNVKDVPGLIEETTK
jgi:transcriptional regulator with XRE-family HTH domain